MEHFEVQIVEHVNYVAFVEAESQEEAEQMVIENVNNPSFDWVKMDGGNSCEVCLEDGDYVETDNLKE